MHRRLAVILPVYLLLYSICYLGAFLLRFDFWLNDTLQGLFWRSLPFVLGCKCAIGLLTRDWHRKHRYTTVSDLLHIVGSAVGTSGLVLLFDAYVWSSFHIPRSIVLIDCVLSILAICSLRCGIRLYVEHFKSEFANSRKKRTLIYSVDGASIGILRAIQSAAPEYRVVAFLDKHFQGPPARVAGIPVYSTKFGLQQIARRLRVKHVLIPSAVPGRDVRSLINECRDAGLKASLIPAVQDIVEGRYKLKIRDVTISDLLRREPAQLDLKGILDCVSGRRVLVTGAAGSIGSELCRQILDLNPESLILVDQSESGIFEMEQEFASRIPSNSDCQLHYIIADIADAEAVERLMDEHRPHLVYHAAAYKHVPLMEANPKQAISNNVLGTKVVVDLAHEHDVERFVLISTDKAVRPTSIMGASKLLAEKYLQAMAAQSTTRFITVRFGNVLDSAGSVVPTFRRQIHSGGPLTVTHPEMQRYFMTIPEAVQLVIQASAIGRSGDVLILDMGEPVKILDLAKDMIYLSGLTYPDDIEIVFTGTRPGEKLNEELFYTSEAGSTKIHDKIFCAKRRSIAMTEMNRHLARLKSDLNASNSDAAQAVWLTVEHVLRTEELSATELKSAA